MSVDKYTMLDLSAFAAELQQGLRTETVRTATELSHGYDQSSLAALLSPHEQYALNRHVAPARAAALAEINTSARRMRMDGDDEGMFDPIERANAQRAFEMRLREISEDFERKNAGLLRDYQEKDRDYRRHKNAANGREAKTPSNWLIWGLLFPLVLIPEALLNFETFRKVPLIKSDAVALGTTILVAYGIAFAAHNIGKFVRQYYYFTRGDDARRGNSGWPMLWGGVVTLLVCLAAVAYARYFYIKPMIAQALALGQMPPSISVSLIGLLAGNLICFLIGAGIAWMLHDPNPEYEDAAKQRRKLEAQLAKLRAATIDKPRLTAKRRLQSDLNDVESKSRVMQGNPAYANLMADYDRVRSKDLEVISLLQEFRKHFGERLQALDPRFEFAVKDYSGSPILFKRTVSAAEYQAAPLVFSSHLS